MIGADFAMTTFVSGLMAGSWNQDRLGRSRSGTAFVTNEERGWKKIDQKEA